MSWIGKVHDLRCRVATTPADNEDIRNARYLRHCPDLFVAGVMLGTRKRKYEREEEIQTETWSWQNDGKATRIKGWYEN